MLVTESVLGGVITMHVLVDGSPGSRSVHTPLCYRYGMGIRSRFGGVTSRCLTEPTIVRYLSDIRDMMSFAVMSGPTSSTFPGEVACRMLGTPVGCRVIGAGPELDSE